MGRKAEGYERKRSVAKRGGPWPRPRGGRGDTRRATAVGELGALRGASRQGDRQRRPCAWSRREAHSRARGSESRRG